MLELPYAGRSAHLHMVRLGQPFFEKHVRFRDILQSNEAVHRRYRELKARFAEQDWPSGAAYAEAKSTFIGSILGGGT